ncbi:lysozyme inhibitor LprI family protein [Acidisoma sp. 7E03]
MLRAAALCLAVCWTAAPAWALDCTRARTRPDRLICATPALAQADRAMAAAYDALRAQLPREEQHGLLTDQRQWLSERASCILDDTGQTAPDAAATVCMQKTTEERRLFLGGETGGGLPRITPRFVYSPGGPGQYAVDIAYPEIQQARTEAQKAANLLLRRQVTGTWDGSSDDEDDGAGSDLAFAARYRVTRLTPAFLSLEVTTYQNSGAAYPTVGGLSLALDLTTGRLLPLTALLRADATAAAADLCTDQLTAYYSTALGSSWAPEAAAVTAVVEDGANWSFLPQGAVIAFREDSLGPHALGAYDCRIDAPTLAGMARPGGPLPPP